MTKRRSRFAIAGVLLGLNLFSGNTIIVLHNLKKAGVNVDDLPILVNIVASIVAIVIGYLIYKFITVDKNSRPKYLTPSLGILLFTSFIIGGIIRYNHTNSYIFNDFVSSVGFFTITIGIVFLVLGFIAKD